MIHKALLIWGVAHALYLAAAARVLSSGRRHETSPIRSRRMVALVLAIGLIPRLLLLPTAPTLSEDLYRYLWDGRLVAHGVNPYPHAPSHPSLTRFRDGLYQHLNHATVPTIYPPAAQLLFAAAALLGGTPLAWKMILLALEAALILALLSLLVRRGMPPERLLLYYWNPLIVVECYGSGHLDLALAAFLIVALALEASRKQAAAGLAFGAAILTKLLPLLLIPTLVRRRAWTLIALAAALTVALYLPFATSGVSLWEGLRIYARHWDFNGPLYSLIRPAFQTGDAPRLILAAALVLASCVIAFRARSWSGAAMAVWIAFLALSPTVYPWYLVPAVALLPLDPNPGLLVLSGTVALTYLPLSGFRATGVWSLPPWILWVEYGLALGAWAVVSLAGRRERRRGDLRRETQPGRG